MAISPAKEVKTQPQAKSITVEFIDNETGEVTNVCRKVCVYFADCKGEEYLHKIVDCLYRGFRLGKNLSLLVTTRPVNVVEQPLFDV